MVARRRPSGTTIAELLVVTVVFSLLMVLILAFYIEGAKVTRRQDKHSDAYRQVITLAEKVETLVARARVFEVQGDRIVFAPQPENDLVQVGLPVWPTVADTLYVQDRTETRHRRLVHVHDGRAADMVEFKYPNDTLVFSLDTAQGLLSLTAYSDPEIDGQRQEGVKRRTAAASSAIGSGIEIRRYIVLENFERY